MSGSNSYGKISTSGLTFAYDTGEIFNSYKGEATTNLVTYSEYQFLADGYTEALSGWDTHEGTMLIDVANKVPGFTNRSIKMSCINANVYKFHFGSTLTNGQTYTVSFWAKAQVAGGYQNFMLGEGMWGSGGGYLVIEPGQTTNLTTEFQRFKYTFTHTLPTGTYNFATYLYGNGLVAWLSGFQLENKSQATRYLPCNGAPTTRSSTQGLLDLTGNNEINIGNVSFTNNSLEEITFDGTDDYISLPNGLMQGTGNFTVNQIIKCDAGVAGGTTFGSFPSGPLQIFYGNTYIGMWLDNNSTYVASPVPFTTNTVMITATRNGSITKFYQNGELLKTGSVSSSVGSSGTLFRIGSNTVGTERYAGKIYTTHIYNRALSETEIRNNFIQYADRYNMTVKDGSTSALAAPSATYLKNIGISRDGNYWLQPSGQSAFQAPVRFHLDKAMVCVMKGGNGNGFLPDSAYWENSTLLNENDFSLTNGSASKYQSYNVVPFTEFYFQMGLLDYQTTFSLGSEVASMLTAQQRSWNSSLNRSSPHYGNSVDYRTLNGADYRYQSALGTEIYLMGMDLKHEGHYGGGAGSSGGRIRVGSILDESTGNTGALTYGAAGSAFGIGVNGGNPLKAGVCGYGGWTEPTIIGGNDNWSVWVVF